MRDLRALPKAELHIHLEGSIRIETLLELADRNGSSLRHGLPTPGVSTASWISSRTTVGGRRLRGCSRHVGFSDEELAALSSAAVRASFADDGTKEDLLAGIEAWLTAPAIG